MKKRILRIGIIIAVTSIIMVNLQILTDTSDNPLGATAKASDEFYGYYGDEDPTGNNSDQIKYHYLKNVWCVVAYLDIDFDWKKFYILSLPTLDIDCEIDFNGSKWACKEIAQESECNISEQTVCQSNNKDEEGDSSSDIF